MNDNNDEIKTNKFNFKNIGKMIVKMISSLVLLFIVIVIIFVIYININKGDIKTVDDSSLLPSAEIISKENNVYFDFVLAMDNLYWPPEKSDELNKMAEGIAWNSELAKELIEKNKVALHYIDSGLQKKEFQQLQLQKDLETLDATMVIKSMSNLRNVAKIRSIQSQLLLAEGNEREAFEKSISILAIGNKLQNLYRPTLIDYIIGLAVKGIGIGNLQLITAKSNLTATDAKMFQDIIGKYADNRDSLQKVIEMEYVTIKNTKRNSIDNVITGKVKQDSESMEAAFGGQLPLNDVLMKSTFYYKPNETQQLFADHYNKLKNDSLKNCNEIKPVEQVAVKSFPKVLITENAVGKILTDIVSVSMESLHSKRCQEDFEFYSTQFMLAAQSYKNENGSYPDTMEKLMPKYMNNVLNSFDGKNINYNASKGIVNLDK